MTVRFLGSFSTKELPADFSPSELSADTLAFAQFAPRLAGRLATLPAAERAAARIVLLAQLEALT